MNIPKYGKCQLCFLKSKLQAIWADIRVTTLLVPPPCMAVVSSPRSVGSWWKVIFPCQEMESFNHMEEQFPQKSPRWLPIWTIPVTLISSFLILVMIRPLPWFAGHNYGPKEAVQRRGWLFSLAIGNCIVSFSPSACRIAVFFFRYQVVFFFVERDGLRFANPLVGLQNLDQVVETGEPQ